MEKIKNYEMLNSHLIDSEGINFILVGPSSDQPFSSHLKEDLKARAFSVRRNDPNGILLLPF